MRGRTQAVGVTTLCAILTLFLPPIGYLSGVPVGLVTLARGASYGLQIIVASLLLTGILAWAALQWPLLALSLALGVWIPVWLCALVLRVARSQNTVLLAVGTLAALFVVSMYVATGDPAIWWRAWLQAIIQSAGYTRGDLVNDVVIERAAPYMNGMVAAAITLGLMVNLITARWWQAILYNPGGFKAEFYTLRLPRFLALLLAVTLGLVFIVDGVTHLLLRDVLFVAVTMYLFQGLAVIHHYVARQNRSVAWLVALYVLLLVTPPQMVLLVACVGLADAWLDFRGSAGPGSGAGKEDIQGDS